jgi:hypothetical protein
MKPVAQPFRSRVLEARPEILEEETKVLKRPKVPNEAQSRWQEVDKTSRMKKERSHHVQRTVPPRETAAHDVPSQSPSKCSVVPPIQCDERLPLVCRPGLLLILGVAWRTCSQSGLPSPPSTCSSQVCVGVKNLRRPLI